MADILGRVFKIIPLTNNVRAHFGTSITRSSIRNSPKYFLTSLGVGLSGEPKFTNKTPFMVINLGIEYIFLGLSHIVF